MPSVRSDTQWLRWSLTELTVDRVALWSQGNEAGLAPTTAKIALITLNQVCRFALLEPGEKPRWKPGRVAILEGDDLAKVLDHAGPHRPPFEMLAYTGLRIGELLGLVWADVDFDGGILHVHRQLSRKRLHRQLKTEAAEREVILAPALMRLLRQRWLASAHKGPDALIFCTRDGRGLDYRRVGDVFRAAVTRSRVRKAGRLSLHSLRHGSASLLIAKRLDPVFVSRRLGHANANVTLPVYSHLLDRREHGELARQAFEASYAAMASASG